MSDEKTIKLEDVEKPEDIEKTESRESLKTGTEDIDLPKSKPSNSKSFVSGLLSLVSVITFLGLGLLGYFAFTQFQQVSGRLSYLEQQQKNNQSQTSKTSTALNQKFQQLQNQLKQDITQQSTTASLKIASIAKQLNVTQRQIQSVNGRHQSDWLLAEADYLVRIASNRLLLERDFTTALSLLLSADERILLMDDPSLQPAREALARDMAVLRTIQREDVAGIAIRISALMPQLKSLAIMSFQLPEENVEDDAQTLVTEGDWFDNLKKTFKELSVKWFEVRDHGQRVKPLMNAEEEAVIRINIALLLQNAQYAVLKQHSNLYDQSLTQLKEWLVENFDVLDPAVSAFITEVDLLKAISIRAELPESLESRLVISRQIERRLAEPSQEAPKQQKAQGEQQ